MTTEQALKKVLRKCYSIIDIKENICQYKK